MDHCDDCDVCIDNFDHHCVFFSKCIGGGNISCFYGAIFGLIFNFILCAVFVMYSVSSKRKVHRVKPDEVLMKEKAALETKSSKMEVPPTAIEEPMINSSLNVQDVDAPTQILTPAAPSNSQS